MYNGPMRPWWFIYCAPVLMILTAALLSPKEPNNGREELLALAMCWMLITVLVRLSSPLPRWLRRTRAQRRGFAVVIKPEDDENAVGH